MDSENRKGPDYYKMLNVNELSDRYRIKRTDTEDIDDILRICLSNPLYYEYCPPPATRESILLDFAALPPDVSIENKYFIGFFSGDRLVAIMDLIDGYPDKKTVFIGFFMVDAGIQRKGTGSAIINDVTDYLTRCGYCSVRLAWIKGNPQAEHFWMKNGFVPIKETVSTDGKIVVLAERTLHQSGENDTHE